ncbi:MAG: HEAT repeat domain-containing protein, partial [Gemmatimonadales bacterium]
KDRILFSVSQTDDPAARQWLLGIARNQAEPVEVRKKALFWYGQKEGTAAELVGLYDQVSDVEMKEQLIFVYAQSDEKAATDKLIDIVRRESNPDLRKKALFWLGQSDDPRVIDVLQSVIEQ